MSETTRSSWECTVSIGAGLIWLISGAAESVAGFVLSAVPGSLLLAGGVSQLWLPRDLRILQMSALGGAVGVVAALPMLFVVGLTGALWLLVLATASLISAGWASQSRQISVASVPQPSLDLMLAAKIGLDEAILVTVPVARRGFGALAAGRIADEVRAAHSLFQERGWMEKPRTFHAEPPELASQRITWKETRGLRFEHLSFESGYEPPAGAPGRRALAGLRPEPHGARVGGARRARTPAMAGLSARPGDGIPVVGLRGLRRPAAASRARSQPALPRAAPSRAPQDGTPQR